MPVTESSALEFLETHPDEGSMLAYADALNHFKIENAAIRIKQEDLITLPTPFIAFSQMNGGTFSVVKSLTENTIEWFDTQKGWVNDKLEEFTKTWSGVVLLAETDEKSGEKNYTSKRRNEILSNLRIPIAVSIVALVFFYFILKASLVSLPTYILLGLKIVGMVISTLLFIKSIDNANSLVNKLCNAGSKISCQSILDSPAAKITSWFTLSDAGFIYFFGSFLDLLLSLKDTSSLNTYFTLQLVFSSFALLFSSYSLYYQGIKAKMWCLLCLGAVSIFFLEALLTFSFTTFQKNTLNIQGLLNTAIGFLLPVAFLVLYKTTAIRVQESISLKKELTKLKSNPHIFESILFNQIQMPQIPGEMTTISIGNREASHTLTIVSNPYCQPCATIHKIIENLIESKENLKCELIFLASNHHEDYRGVVARGILSLSKEKQSEALNRWFNSEIKDIEKWKIDFQIVEDSSTAKIIEKHTAWCKVANIESTPTLFLDGFKFPNTYRLGELKRILKFHPSKYQLG